MIVKLTTAQHLVASVLKQTFPFVWAIHHLLRTFSFQMIFHLSALDYLSTVMATL